MEQFNSLYNQTANGFTDFAIAQKRWEDGYYEGYAINPFSMRRVQTDKESFIYLRRFDDMPPIRIDITQLVTFPYDENNQIKYMKWFYNSLRCGKKMPFNGHIKKQVIKKKRCTRAYKCSIKDFIVNDGYSYEDSEYKPY